MKHPVRIAFFVTGTALLVIQSSHASAFQTIVHTPLSILTKFQPSTSTIRNHRNILSVTSNTRMSSAATTSFGTENTAPLFRLRGGSSDTDPAAFKPVSPPVKKIRIAAFDSMRFFLIINIVLGHFGRFANPPARLMTAFSQHNVIVGAFFALSGYVTAYTTTELGKRIASPKLLETPKQKWILQKIFGYYPLHLAVLILFSPVFIYADNFYNGPITTIVHAIMSLTMTQAWMPQHAEIWNAPTWFLGALTFATAIMPYCLPAIASLNKIGLVKTGFWIWLTYLLPKLGYCYDFNTWKIAEGITSPKAHPNYEAFNGQRFSPVFAVAEVLLGVIACRIVMLDGTEKDTRQTNALSTLVPLTVMLGLIAARANGLLDITDLLFRSVFFVPLFLRFLMAAHRNTTSHVKGDMILNFLNNPWLIMLGNLSFPIFIVHGPMGQIFFKKLIATKLFGQVLNGPVAFGGYMLAVFVAAFVLQKMILQNNIIQKWSKHSVDTLSEWF